MKTLAIDIETFSSGDLIKGGVYKYVDAPDFTILLFAYSIDGGKVEIVDLASGEQLPVQIQMALSNDAVLKTAYNAQFERVCLTKYFDLAGSSPESWECTMVKAAMLGYPFGLDKVAQVMNLEQQKDTTGKQLIRYFSLPCKPTKVNENRTRNLPHHAPDKWQQFKDYCVQDVVVEQSIRQKINWFSIPDVEKKLWALDQRINDTGVLLDKNFASNAISINNEYVNELTSEAVNLTNLANPNSAAQLKTWLSVALDTEVTSLTKKAVPALLEISNDQDVTRVLEIRQEMSKTSVKKYAAMLSCICEDSRVRGLLQFYGANRTGRWCLTGDHEVLTEEGWAKLEKWQGGKIACWNPSGEAISFQKSTDNVFDYSGEMFSINHQRCEQVSTPDHTVPYWKDGWKSTEIKNLYKRFQLAFTGERQSFQHYENWQLRVLIMVQADGHYTNDGILRLKFSKRRKIERCKTLLRKADILFSLTQYDNVTVFTVRKKDQPLFLRMFTEKVFGWWMLDENPDLIFDEIEHWDAYRCGPNSIQYSSVVKQNVEIIQAIATLSGRSCTQIVKERAEENWSNAYVANIWLTPGKTTHVRVEQISKIQYSGKVYCPTTPTGFFIVRRNGKVWVTGNSSRLVQVQNLPQNHISDLELARSIVTKNDLELLEMLYGNVPDTLSQLIRTAFVAGKGKRFIVADLSAIEARVIAWLAGERWRLEVFNTHGKIYEASASQMFKVPIESIKKGSDLRQKGKVAELACIAEGELVLTDIGLIPIENITTKHKLWDGGNWVRHEGLIFKGFKKVIIYEGLTATADHTVWIKGQTEPVRLEYAATRGSHLLRTGDGRRAIRLGKNNQFRKTMEKRLGRPKSISRMRKLWFNILALLLQFSSRQIKWVSAMLATEKNTKMVGSEAYSRKTTLYKSKRWELSQLRWSWNLFQIQLCFGGGFMDFGKLRLAGKDIRIRQDKQQRPLRTWESTVCTKRSESEQSKIVKTYDILNAGPNNCFTVSNVLVHNCGYQGGPNALIQMGALEMGIPEEELPRLIKQWRNANKKIVDYWNTVNNAAIDAIDGENNSIKHGIKFSFSKGALVITLPSGRSLYYQNAKLVDGKFGGKAIVYEGMNQTTKKWERIDTYGGKLVENIVQAIARDVLADIMLRIDGLGYKIVMSIHDEIVLECPVDFGSCEEVNQIMGTDIIWAKGLPLKADSYETSFYKKD